MEEAQFLATFNYIKKKEYPPGYTKTQKYVLRRSCKSFLVEEEQLFYVDRRPDGTTFNRLVLQGRSEAERVFMECHLTTEGHRGRDATLEKIKERYYWPNYYKEVEGKVRRSVQVYSSLLTNVQAKVYLSIMVLVWYCLYGPCRLRCVIAVSAMHHSSKQLLLSCIELRSCHRCGAWWAWT